MQLRTVTSRNGHQYESTVNLGKMTLYCLAMGGIVRPKGYKNPAEYEAYELTEE